MTLLTYGMLPMIPDTSLTADYSALSVDIENMTETIEGSMTSQLEIPIIDMGALLFYSGNILMDLMMNFITAIPSALTLLINTFNVLFPIDVYILTTLKIFIFGFGGILYIISLIVFLLNLRSGGVSAV